jgi:hypothetical protein
MTRAELLGAANSRIVAPTSRQIEGGATPALAHDLQPGEAKARSALSSSACDSMTRCPAGRKSCRAPQTGNRVPRYRVLRTQPGWLALRSTSAAHSSARSRTRTSARLGSSPLNSRIDPRWCRGSLCRPQLGVSFAYLRCRASGGGGSRLIIRRRPLNSRIDPGWRRRSLCRPDFGSRFAQFG